MPVDLWPCDVPLVNRQKRTGTVYGLDKGAKSIFVRFGIRNSQNFQTNIDCIHQNMQKDNIGTLNSA